MATKHITYQVQEDEAGRIDVCLARLLQISRARVRGLIDHGTVTVNGTPCHDYGHTLHAADGLAISYDPERKYREKPPLRKTQGFDLIYHDQHLAVVNKHAGLLTVPTDRREQNTLVDTLSHFLAAGQKRSHRVSVVHRLDRDTSGLLVFGRHPAVTDELIKQFAARKPERLCLAIVAGHVSKDKAVIQSYLQTDEALNQKSAASGELAITHYTVLQRLREASLLSVNLETGRRNQIRVHMAELGHPILGDSRYMSELACHHRAWPHKRLALHAQKLGFDHPVTRRSMSFDTEWPDEFKRFISST